MGGGREVRSRGSLQYCDWEKAKLVAERRERLEIDGHEGDGNVLERRKSLPVMTEKQNQNSKLQLVLERAKGRGLQAV